MEKNSRIYIAGHETLAGASLLYRLEQQGYTNIVYRTKEELNLQNRNEVQAFFQNDDIDYVFLAAEVESDKNRPAEVIEGNLSVQTNIIDSAYRYGVFNLIYICNRDVYPAVAPQPVKEEYLLSSYLQHTHEPYAIAKLAGIKMCQAYNEQYGTNYITVIPATLFGQSELTTNKKSSVTTYMEYIHHAKNNDIDAIQVTAKENDSDQFIHCNDFADVCIQLMKNKPSTDIINIGNEGSIRQSDILSYLTGIMKYRGKVIFSKQYYQPTPQVKLLDVSRLAELGFEMVDSMTTDIERLYGEFIGRKDVALG